MSPAGALGKRTMKKGGAAHEDIKADKALIKKMVKPSARTGKAIGGAFGEYLSPALMLANAVRGDDKKRGGRTGKNDGGGLRQSERTLAENAKRNYMDARENEQNYLAKNDVRDPYDSRRGALAELGKAATQAKQNYQQVRDETGYKKGGKAKRTGKAIGGAFGEYLSPALMLANAVRGDDKKRGGKAMRKGREDGGGAYSDEGFDAAESARAANMLYDASRRGKDRITMTPNDYENMVREIGENIAHSDAAYDQERYRNPSPATLDAMARQKTRAKRKDGGGVFSGPGYPGKVPGVTGGRIARATGGSTKGKGKGKTNINIVIATGKPAGQQGMMNPGDIGPTPPPGAGAGPQGMPVPIPAAAGAGAGAAPMPMPIPMPMPMGGAGGGQPPMARKSGGRITKVASSYKDMEAGSGGGEGRLQKTDIAKKHKDAPAFKKGGKVYRSYKDMDAGAGSGMGRLEKTEIQARKG
jgi:hypothetical protein